MENAHFIIISVEVDDLSTRIIGGINAKRKEIPYQAYLNVNGTHVCGGVIYNEWTIITAKKCVENYEPSDMKAMAGSNYLDHGGSSYDISNLVSFEGKADLGLVITETKMQFSSTNNKIPLSKTHIGGNIRATVSGWGVTNIIGDVSVSLRKLYMRTMTENDCNVALQNMHTVTSRELCAFSKAGQGICIGDAGSPLVVNGKLAGIASWSYKCGIGYPDVFARISEFDEWIENNAEE